MKNSENYFKCNYTGATESLKSPLTKEEKLEGNALLLRFMDFEYEKSEKWLLECAHYDRSYEELMKVAAKIDTFWDEETSWINGEKFNLRHMMFHQVLNFNEFYRKIVRFVKNYYKWLEE